MLYLDKTDPREDVACRTEGIGDISLLTHRPATRTAIQPGKRAMCLSFQMITKRARHIQEHTDAKRKSHD